MDGRGEVAAEPVSEWRAYKQEFADVRDVVQGLVLALEKDAAVGEEFTLGGAAVFRWEEHVPWFAERYGLEYVDARLPESNFFEFDLSKIKGLLGYEPRHDVQSVVETAEAIRRGGGDGGGSDGGSVWRAGVRGLRSVSGFL